MSEIVVSEYSAEEEMMIAVSRAIFTYKGFTGGVHPWHDRQRKFDKDFDSKGFIRVLNTKNMPIRSYCILSALLASPSSFFDARSLYAVLPVLSNIEKFYAYCNRSGRPDLFDKVADLALAVLYYRAESSEPVGVYFTKANTIKKEDVVCGAPLESAMIYHELADRIRKFEVDHIDPYLWATEKYKRCLKGFKDNFAFSVLVNFNSFEPDMTKLVLATNDEWRPLREFLGVSLDCEFPDGYIPKGWRPSSDRETELVNIKEIRGSGFYYYKDGSQHLGKRHYCQNQYLIIKCDPTNFNDFKGMWDDKRLLMATPTWDEYDKWGAKGAVEYDEFGKNLNERGEGVKWRRK